MIRSLLRRLLLLMMTLLALSLVSYSIMRRDPLNQALAQPYFYSGYWHYIQGLLQGELGITYNGGESLKAMVWTVLPPTIELCFAAMLLASLFGIPLGLLGASYSNHWIGKSIRAVSSLGISVPVFWIAPILLYISAIYRWEISAVGQFNLLYEIKPITGFAIVDVWFVEEPYRLKIIQNVLQHLALPTLVLMISPTMEMIRLVQERAEYVFKQNYVKIASTRGWSKLRILRYYVIRNTLAVIIPQITRVFSLVLAQCMLIENTCGWPGIGRWLIDAVIQQDYNSISAGVMVIGLFVICINILSECVTFGLDPFKRKGWYAR